MIHLSHLRHGLILFLALLLALPAAAEERWFGTDALNPGLGPAPAMIDRATPMSTVESFLALTRKGDYAAAAHLLDLSALPQDTQAETGAIRASQLAEVLERKVVIPWDNLADRPDGWLEGSAKNEATGRVRRSILLGSMTLDDHPVPIRLNRIKPGETADPVWVFSAQTVDNIDPLYQLYGPTRLEQNLPDWARARAIGGMYVWEVLFVPLLLVVAGLCPWFSFRFLHHMGRNAPPRWMRFLGRSARWPVAISFFAAVLGTGTREILVVSGLLDTVLAPILVIAYVFSVALALVLIIDEVFDRISQNNPNELADPENSHMRAMATTITAARKALIVIAVLIGTGVVLSSINTLDTLGLSLLASAGALTVVLGFAAREVLGNILASVQIALNRSARIGDQLMFEGHFCTVERIHFTYVQLMIWNGTRLIVPVSTFVSDAFENWSIEDPAMVRPIELTLAQDADVAAMRRAFQDLLDKEDDADVAPRARAAVRVTGQDVFGLKVRFELPAANPATGWDLECRVREGLQEAARRLERDGTPVLPPKPDDLPDA